MILPNTAVLELTYRCNHRCIFCSCPWFAPGSSYPRQAELTTEQWFKVIDTLYEQGVETFAFSGGECTLREDLSAILAYLDERSHDLGKNRGFTLISNGLNLGDGLLQEFKEHHIHLSLSLPGFATFKRHTGVDNALGVLQTMQRAATLGLKVTANVTVTALNLSELYETLSLPLLNGASSLLLNRFLPGGRGLSHVAELSLNLDELNLMLDTAEEVLQSAGRRGHIGTEIPLCAIKTPKKYQRLSMGFQCAAAKGFFVVDPSGRIRACNHSPVIIGDALSEPMISDNAAWQSYVKRDYQPEHCASCSQLSRCDCGCREVARITQGSLSAVDDSMIGFRPLPQPKEV